VRAYHPGGGIEMNRTLWTVGLLLALVVLPGSVAVTAVVAPMASPSNALFLSGPHHGTVSSTNWAGFAVTGPTDSVKFVQGSWVQPTANCSGTKTLYASFWVGIDGYNSRTVEQTGTDSDCQAGVPTYYAWYEFFPAYPVTISTVPIHPGNTVEASVTYVNSTVGFKIVLSDLTTGKTFSHSKKVPTAVRSSAEWIAEAPSSSTGVLPLADFGKVKFGTDYTGVAKTCTATISGVNGAIGSFAAASLHRINMINSAGTMTKASTSVLTKDGTSFVVTWKSAGP
jgi:hypothetical protein